MKKQSIKFSDLSKQELEFLKDTYVNEKVKSMDEKEIRDFVFDSISHQIKDTIGNEEEIEAWKEMEIFFEDKFLSTIENIREKFKPFANVDVFEEQEHEKRSKLIDTNKLDNEKEDMWED